VAYSATENKIKNSKAGSGTIRAGRVIYSRFRCCESTSLLPGRIVIALINNDKLRQSVISRDNVIVVFVQLKGEFSGRVIARSASCLIIAEKESKNPLQTTGES
jgi:hypothetical protein